MSDVERDVGVVIVAAGSGSRTGSEQLKQFRWVAGKPMLLHSIQRFMERPDVAIVVAVLPREMIERAYTEARRTQVSATDDAALCELLGFEVVVVPGSELAMKVTVEEDFARLEALATTIEA